ncbi:MAG: hypothetical protein HZC01_02935 [Candidatus Kerfeldbacteria bacterium]|nr:hypothetical protein [Candidatus Kerfeldbacteria bacterium]
MLSIVCGLGAYWCVTMGGWFMILGILLGLACLVLYGVYIATIFGKITQSMDPAQRRCLACQSRHYLVYPRGSRFGFMFPARFVKLSITDFQCQECGMKWTVKEIDEHDAQS